MEKNRHKFAIFGNPCQANNTTNNNATIVGIIELLRSLKHPIVIEEEFCNYLRDDLNVDIAPDEILKKGDDFTAQIALSLGGDGTFLRTAAAVGEKEIPIMGINMGHLGFLADVLPAEAESSIWTLEKGDYFIEKRSVLRVYVEGKKLDVFPNALNEIAILKHDNSSMITIHTLIDDHYLATYQSDGLIVATPTGSTGYSLSVGGPIMYPGAHTLALTPVAPHSLTVRPIVVDDDITIRLSVESRNHNFLISLDGRSQSLPEGAEVKIRRAPYCVNIIKRQNVHFFDTLRQKLLWGVDQRK